MYTKAKTLPPMLTLFGESLSHREGCSKARFLKKENSKCTTVHSLGCPTFTHALLSKFTDFSPIKCTHPTSCYRHSYRMHLACPPSREAIQTLIALCSESSFFSSSKTVGILSGYSAPCQPGQIVKLIIIIQNNTIARE